MVVTVVKPQGGSRKAKLKEEEDKLTTLGTRTDREADHVRRAGHEQQSPKTIKDMRGRIGRHVGKVDVLTWGDPTAER